MTPTGTSKGLTESDKKFINQLFEELRGIFPAWRASLENDRQYKNALRQWAKALIENKLVDADLIEAGLKRCRQHNSPFLPSVGMFVAWCKEALLERLGMPDQDEAWRELDRYMKQPAEKRKVEQLSPPVYWVLKRLPDLHQYKMATAEKSRRQFDRAYAKALDFAKKGNAFLPPPKLVEQKKPEPVAWDVAKTNLDKIRDNVK